MTQSEKTHLRRMKTLERASSADLEALLLLDFQASESSGEKMDEILRAAEILAEREPPQDSHSVDQAWSAFLEKYLPFSDGSSLYESAEAPGASAVAVQPRPAPSPSLRRRMRRLALRTGHPVWYRVLQSAACLALCLLLTGGLLLTFDPGARAAFSGWVREICGDHLEYRYASSGQTTGGEDQSVTYRPAWLPQGYRSIRVEDQGGETTVFYTDGSECGLVFQYYPASVNGFSIYAEGPPEKVTVHGNPADLYSAPQEGQTNLLIWSDTEAELLMSLFSTLPPEDLLRIAESVQAAAPEPPPNRPLWLPEDYSLLSSGGGMANLGISYANGDGEMLSYAYAAAGSASWEQSQVEIREAAAGLESEEISINGLPGRLYRQEDGTGRLVWTNAFDDLYWISGPLTDRELVKMAESVLMGS